MWFQVTEVPDKTIFPWFWKNKNISPSEKTYTNTPITINPELSINGVSNSVYKNTDKVVFTVNTVNQSSIKKIDVFVNDIYLNSFKSKSFTASFIPKEISGISDINTIKVIGYDTSGGVGETTANFGVYN